MEEFFCFNFVSRKNALLTGISRSPDPCRIRHGASSIERRAEGDLSSKKNHLEGEYSSYYHFLLVLSDLSLF